MNLKNAIIVITGGTKGFGKSLAQALDKLGAQVVVSSRNNDATRSDSKIVFIPGDVTNEADMRHLAEQATAQFGRIDLWINNAGKWLPAASANATDMTAAHEMMEVNLFGTVYGSCAALAQMRKQKYGTILNIISSSALRGRPNSAMYAASKFAADGFTKSLRLEIKENNIRVLAVYPGGMKTHLFDAGKPENFDQYMEPEFVAASIISNLLIENPLEELILERPNKKV